MHNSEQLLKQMYKNPLCNQTQTIAADLKSILDFNNNVISVKHKNKKIRRSRAGSPAGRAMAGGHFDMFLKISWHIKKSSYASTKGVNLS